MCRQYCGLSASSRVAEFGCGFGRFASPSRRQKNTQTTTGSTSCPKPSPTAGAGLRASIAGSAFRCSTPRTRLLQSARLRGLRVGRLAARKFRARTSCLPPQCSPPRLPMCGIRWRARCRGFAAGWSFLSTWFLQTPATVAGFAAAPSVVMGRDAGAWVADKKLPESAIGYRIESVETWAAAVGLAVDRVVHGRWSAQKPIRCGARRRCFRKVVGVACSCFVLTMLVVPRCGGVEGVDSGLAFFASGGMRPASPACRSTMAARSRPGSVAKNLAFCGQSPSRDRLRARVESRPGRGGRSPANGHGPRNACPRYLASGCLHSTVQ